MSVSLPARRLAIGRFFPVLASFAVLLFSNPGDANPAKPAASAVSKATPSIPAAQLSKLGVEFLGSRTIDGTSFKIDQYKLKKNGLSILLCERHVTPIVTGMTVYRVGSRNEAVGYTGATHFLEHMMFKGTAKHDPLKGNGIDDSLKPAGAYNNATTSNDRTAYVMVLPKDKFNLWLDLDSDRMRNLLLRQTDRDSEMTVVRNELERSEDDPSDLLNTNSFAMAFKEHPYHHPIIGWRSDVENMPVSRLKKFYDQFYWPNNATVIAIGDFSEAQALQSIAHYFNPIPASPNPFPTVYTQEPPQEGARRFVVQRGADLPRVALCYHTQNAKSKDYYALDVMETILGDENKRSSRLCKDMIDTGIASEADATNLPMRDPGLFQFTATVSQAQTSTPEQLEKALHREIEKLKNDPVADEELDRAKKSLIKRMKLSSSDPVGLAEQLTEAVSNADWVWFTHYPEGINAVTKDDIKRVANKYFLDSNMTAGIYLPKTAPEQAKLAAASPPGAGSESIATGSNAPSDVAPDATKSGAAEGKKPAPEKTIVAAVKAGADGVSADAVTALKPADVSAAADPVVGSNPAASLSDSQLNGAETPVPLPKHVTLEQASRLAMALPSAQRPLQSGTSKSGRTLFTRLSQVLVLPNGFTVVVLPARGSGTVAVSLRVAAGGYFSSTEKSQVPDLLADLLTRGSKKYGKEEMASRLDAIGVTLQYAADDFWIGFNTEVASEDLQALLPLVADSLRNPMFAAKELEHSESLRASSIKDKMADTQETVANAFARALYKPESVYYDKPFEEQLSELGTIKTKDLVSFHRAHFSPSNTVLTLVGDISPEQALDLANQYFGSWTGVPRVPINSDQNDVLKLQGSKEIAVNIPDKANADAIIGRSIGLGLGSKEYYAALIANAALGFDSFACRLAPVRDQYGLSYSINSALSGEFPWAPWMISFSTNPENYRKASRLVSKIVDDYVKGGITLRELELEKTHLEGAFYVGLRGPRQIAARLCELEIMGLGAHYLDNFSDRLNNVTQSQANSIIRRDFNLKNSVSAVSGTLNKMGK